MIKPARLAFLIIGLCSPAFLSRAAAETSGNETAYAALHAIRHAMGPASLDHLVEVSGAAGAPQPASWKVILHEGHDSWREIDVTGGKITGKRPAERPPGAGGVIKLTALNLDSSGAFDAADLRARKVKVRFESINYLLRVSPSTGKPTWTLDLFNSEGLSAGSMRLTATDGTIASLSGRLADGPGRPGQPLTASNAVTTTTVTTTIPGNGYAPPAPEPQAPPPPPPPPVHDVDVPPAPAPPPAPVEEQESGGFFTRAGRTLDHTQVRVANSLGTASQKVVQGLDTANQKVDHSLRATGAKLQRFFTGHSDLDRDNEDR
jgi:hypothetical protein